MPDPRPTTPSPPVSRLLSDYFQTGLRVPTYRPKGSGSWLVMLTTSGYATFRQPGDFALPMQAGDLLLVEPDAYSEYGGPEAEAWQVHWCHFLPPADWRDRLQFAPVGDGLHHLRLAAPTLRLRLEAAFLRLHADLRAGGAWGEELAMTALGEILLLAARQAGDAAPRDSRVIAAIAAMQADLAHPFSVADLARQVGLSPSRFAHLYRAATGESPLQGLLRLRVGQAKRLLLHTDEPAGRIGAALGFASPTYFARVFRRQTGVTPSAWRRGGTRGALTDGRPRHDA